MDGTKPQRIQMQFSMIQSEKDRLTSCLNATIRNAERLAETARGPVLSRLQQDNYRLLGLLSQWADAAESQLAQLYSVPESVLEPAQPDSALPGNTAAGEPLVTPPALPAQAKVAAELQPGPVEGFSPVTGLSVRQCPPSEPANPPGAIPAMEAVSKLCSLFQTVQGTVQDVKTPSPMPRKPCTQPSLPFPAILSSPPVPSPTVYRSNSAWKSPQAAGSVSAGTAASLSPPAAEAALRAPLGVASSPAAAASLTQCSVASFYTAEPADFNSCSEELPRSPLPEHSPALNGNTSNTNTEGKTSARTTVGGKSSLKSMAAASSLVQRHLQNKKTAPEPSQSSPVQKPLPQPTIEEGQRRDVIFSCWSELPNYMYLNLKEDMEMLEGLQKRLTELGGQRPGRLPRAPSVGDLVMAPWTDGWYRAEVRHVTDQYPAMLELHYIDYGNDDHQSAADVCFLPQEYKARPPAAYKCIARHLLREGECLSPLQRRLLEYMLTGPAVHVSAVFHRTPVPAVYQVDLVSELPVGDCIMSADVVATLNSALEVEPARAEKLCASPELDVAPLVVQYRPTVPPAQPADPAPAVQMATDEKVLTWLKAQSTPRQPARPPAKKPPTPPRPTAETKRTERQAPGGGRSRPPRLREPVPYQGLHTAWSARPLHRLPSSNQPLVVCVLYALAPDYFYISLGDHHAFDGMQARLQEAYSALPLHPKQMVSQLQVPGSYWVALRQSDRHWYRCVVLRQSENTGEDEVTADYPVLWVDFGDEDRVPSAHFRPITEEFAAIPLFATRARCAGICPADEHGQPADRFSVDSCQVFRDVLQDTFCRAYPVLSESDHDCLAVTLEMEKDDQYLSVTELLVNASLVALRHPGLAESDSCSLPGSWSAEGGSPRPGGTSHTGDAAEWDPMEEDYVSPYNRIGAEGPEDLGMRGQPDPEDEVCAIYARGGKCWDGIACKRRHIRGGDRQPAQTAVFVEPPEALRLPRVDITVLVRVTEVRSPASFHVQLLHGATPAELVSANPGEYLRGAAREETLESLTAAMTAACRAKRRLDYGVDCLPAVGELVLAPWEDGFHRARVINLRLSAQTTSVEAEVFLVDTGVVIERDVKGLRLMEKQFNLLAFQAVQCSLGFVSPPAASGWTPQAVQRFVQLVGSAPSLLATVLSRRPDGGLELDLCVHGASGRVTRINQTLIREGLARSRPHRLPEIGAHVPFVPM